MWAKTKDVLTAIFLTTVIIAGVLIVSVAIGVRYILFVLKEVGSDSVSR